MIILQHVERINPMGISSQNGNEVTVEQLQNKYENVLELLTALSTVDCNATEIHP